jgi:hypothetical protein
MGYFMRLPSHYTIQGDVALGFTYFTLIPPITSPVVPIMFPINIGLIISAFILLSILSCCFTHIYIVHNISSARFAVTLVLCFYYLVYYSTPLHRIYTSFIYHTPLHHSFLNAPIYYISTVGTMTSLACGHCPPFSSFHAFIHGGPSQFRSNDGVIQYFYETLPPEASPAASDLFPPFLPLLPPPVSSFPSPSVENDGTDVDAAPASVFLFTTCAVVGADPLILASP